MSKPGDRILTGEMLDLLLTPIIVGSRSDHGISRSKCIRIISKWDEIRGKGPEYLIKGQDNEQAE